MAHKAGLAEFSRWLADRSDSPAFFAGSVAVSHAEIGKSFDALDAILRQNGFTSGAKIGLVVRNLPYLIGTLAGLLVTGRSIVMINAYLSDQQIAEQIKMLDLPVVIAAAGDWQDKTRTQLGAMNCLGLAINAANGDVSVELQPSDRPPQAGDFDPETAIQMLTSGTTGAPKNIPIRWSTLSQAIINGKQLQQAQSGQAQSDRSEVFIQSYPPGNIGGLYAMLPNIALNRPIALLDRFDFDQWLQALRRHKPTFINLAPAALRKIIDTHVTPQDMASVRVIRSGSAPVGADILAYFMENYGVPVLNVYGATEFCGIVAGWHLDDVKPHYQTKRGSVGHAIGGCELRVMDDNTPCPTGIVGRLEVLCPHVSPNWQRTTDLASMDEDGFVFLLGRADSVINRGGFKVFPDKIVEALRSHPAIAEASIVALDDPRLGQIPVAAIELSVPQTRGLIDDLKTHLRQTLQPQAIPAKFFIFDALPRTPSMKISQKDVIDMVTKAAQNEA